MGVGVGVGRGELNGLFLTGTFFKSRDQLARSNLVSFLYSANNLLTAPFVV